MPLNSMRVLLASIVPPQNDCGSRILMHRHLVANAPFELHVASNADYEENLLIHTRIRFPKVVERIRKSRFGPKWHARLMDFQNYIWPCIGCPGLERAITDFQPHVILTLAEPSLSWIALRSAKKRGVPFAAFFMDWFPVMEGHFGLAASKQSLSQRFRRIYQQSDLAFCVSDGMRVELGPHKNSHILYPISGTHTISNNQMTRDKEKFRLVYVGAALGFYGRMLQQLIDVFYGNPEMEIIVVGPNSDWPMEVRRRAENSGICLGFQPPEVAAEILAQADALLVVMSFEREHELFMRTSFNTKFADYTAFGKPIVFWAPNYAAPMKLVKKGDSALVVDSPDPEDVLIAIKKLFGDAQERSRFSRGARELRLGELNPESIQRKFVNEMLKLVDRQCARG
jgi:glycosyltransferase involved in cell wall biosynthesis